MSSIAASAWQGGTTETMGFSAENNWAYGAKTIVHKGIGGKFAGSVVGTLSFSAFMGGAGAALAGGNFWKGATTGLIVAGFNHLATSLTRSSDASYDSKFVEKSNPDDVRYGDVVNLHTDDYFGALSEWAKQSKPGIGEVELHAHGWRLAVGGMTTVNEISDLLYSKSPTWKAMIDGGMKANIKLTLYSCNTGGSKGIAWKIHQAFPNVTVVAPTANWRVTYHYSWFGGGVKVDSGFVVNPGTWRVFK